MKANPVKRDLRAGGIAVGTNVFEFRTPGIGRIAAEAGADFVVFDMEHTGWSIETVGELIATVRGIDLVPIARVPATQYHFIARVLDVGAMGVKVPLVHDADQAEMIVQAAKYPPRGQRGAAFGIAHDDYTTGDIMQKMRSANDETLLIAQIESAQGVENADAIAAVEGIDILWIGQFDLSNSLGIPGQFEDPHFERAIDRVLGACQRYGKSAAYMATSAAEAGQLLRRGFRCIAYWADLWIYRAALRQGIEQVRNNRC